MKRAWILMLAAVVIMAGFALTGCSKKSPGVQMCEKAVAEKGEKRDCQAEYGKMSKSEQETMDKIGKTVMDECGSKKGKEFEDCTFAAMMKGMGEQLKEGLQKGMEQGMKDMQKGMEEGMKGMHEGMTGTNAPAGGTAPAEGENAPAEGAAPEESGNVPAEGEAPAEGGEAAPAEGTNQPSN